MTKENGFRANDGYTQGKVYTSDYEYYEQEQEPAQTQTREETDKKCIDCGGTMDFDPRQEK